jgi:hypothetical protein
MLTLSAADAVMLAMAPSLMIVVSLFERRWGPVVGGMVAAAPVTALIGLLLVSSNLGRAAGAEMALSMSGYTPAQVAMAVVIVVMIGKSGFTGGLAAGTAVFGALAWASLLVPPPVGVLASVVVLGAALRLMRTPDSKEDSAAMPALASFGMIAIRAAVSLVTALGLLIISKQFGPAAGGALGAYPVFTVTLCAFVFATGGALAVERVLFGMVQGLPAYLTFVLVYALTATPLGVAPAVVLATVACSACYVLQLLNAGRLANLRRLADRRSVPTDLKFPR